MSLENYQKIEIDVCDNVIFMPFPVGVWFAVLRGKAGLVQSACARRFSHAQIYAHACSLLGSPTQTGPVNKKDGTSQIADRQFLLVRFFTKFNFYT